MCVGKEHVQRGSIAANFPEYLSAEKLQSTTMKTKKHSGVPPRRNVRGLKWKVGDVANLRHGAGMTPVFTENND